MERPLFVYGTLRVGQGNWVRHLRHHTPVAEDVRTRDVFTLVSMGGFPGMVKGGTTSVVGDLFDISSETQDRLDMLEGHPDFYRRSLIELEDGLQVQAYLAPTSAHKRPVIQSGDWIAYRKALQNEMLKWR